MTGRSVLILYLMIAGPAWIMPASAQTSKFQQGKDNFYDGSYYKAMEYLNQAIATDRTMSREMLTEAYYYRGLTYIRLHNEAFSGDNKVEQKTYNDALLFAYRDFKQSLAYDDGTWWKQIDLEIKNLHHAMLQEGLTSLNTYNDLVFNGKTDPKLLARAEDYLVSAKEIRESYLVCDLLGQVWLDKGRKDSAAVYFSRSEKLYTEKLPEEPDFLMAYVFYRLAAIHKTDDIRLAMQDNQRGLKFLESEYARFSAIKSKLNAARVQQMEDQYQLALQDLTDLKLDLFMTDTDQYVEALHVFEEELSKQPDNVDVLIGYASLLEKADKEKAILTYKKVLGLDPYNAIALFNLGALYYAKGKDLMEAASKTSGDEDYNLLNDEAMANFKTAGTFFEQALTIEPGSAEIIQALKTIAYILDDQPAYLKYKELESKLNK
jgi:Tfp pilus assembly protein PilF